MRITALLGLWTSPALASFSPSFQKVLGSINNSDLYSYPSDFTRDIVPKRIHSHNDYWRDQPFYSAISYGAISVEADVFLINGTLYVGHETSALKATRTFTSLYVNPILDALSRTNPTTPFVSRVNTRNGIYDASSGQTLYLFVDLKTAGDTTWAAVISALAPLRDAGYLSTTNGTVFTVGPVTVVGTGNTPLSFFQPDPASSASPRYVFFDGPLAGLNATNITALISPIASTSFQAAVGPVTRDSYGKVLNATQLATVRYQLGEATRRGILSRYWETPLWPVGVRNAVWRQLWEEGVGLINADDLAAAARFWEQRD